MDGLACSRRFELAGDAAAYRQDLLLGYASGLRYSHLARRFVPADVADEAPISVAAWTALYWAQKWPTLQPKGRSELARYLSRAAAHFVDIPADSADVDNIRAYVVVALRSDRTDRPLTPAQVRGRSLLEARSLPLASVGRTEVEVFVERCRTHYRHPRAERGCGHDQAHGCRPPPVLGPRRHRRSRGVEPVGGGPPRRPTGLGDGPGQGR